MFIYRRQKVEVEKIHASNDLVAQWIARNCAQLVSIQVRPIDEYDKFGEPVEFDEHMDMLDKRAGNTRTEERYRATGEQAAHESNWIENLINAKTGQRFDQCVSRLAGYSINLAKPANAGILTHTQLSTYSDCSGEVYQSSWHGYIYRTCKNCGQSWMNDEGDWKETNAKPDTFISPVLAEQH